MEMYGSAFRDTLIGTAGNDVIYGGDGSDRLEGGDGVNILFGGYGSDYLIAGPNADTLTGGPGDDFLMGFGPSIAVYTGLKSEYDISYALEDGEFSVVDLVAGRDGHDLAAIGTLLFLDGAVQAAQYISQANIIGGAGPEILSGTNLAESIDGGAGNDTLTGYGGGDIIVAGTGDDVVSAGPGNDIIYDGLGDDTIDAGPGDDCVVAGMGHDVYDGGEGYDQLTFFFLLQNPAVTSGILIDLVAGTVTNPAFSATVSGFEAVQGLPDFADTIIGTDANELIEGYGGGDSMVGGGGNDTLLGQTSNDTLIGGAGDDWLYGTAGHDLISGGDGIDTVSVGIDRSSMSMTKTVTGWSLFGQAPGSNTVRDFTVDTVERFCFKNLNLAVDLDGHAGSTVKLLGVLLGAQSTSDPALVSTGLQLFDGGWSEAAVSSAAASLVFGGSSDEAFVTQLFVNIFHFAPEQFLVDEFTGWLQGGMSRGDLMLAAANSDYNAVNIDLAGLTQSGVAYLLF